MSLTAVQSAHLEKVPLAHRADMARFLEEGVEVVVYRQSDASDDVPPYAIAVAGTDFWIECCKTRTSGVALARKLGLKVLEVKSSTTVG